MFDLIDRIERMGTRGAPFAVLVATLLVAATVGLLVWSFSHFDSPWSPILIRGGAFFTATLSMVFGMVGTRVWLGSSYPDPADVFPSMAAADFKEAVYTEARPLAACANCLIHLPGAYSTGACPRCQSALCWYEIHTDEDADLVVSSVTA